MPIGDEQWINEQLAQLATQRPAAMPTGSPDDGASRSWTGLLGGVLGGGQAPGYQLRGSEADTSGNRALLNFGIQTLLASGPSSVRPDLLSALATGLQGAQSSTDLDQRRGQAQAQAQYGYAKDQQEQRLAALKEALPLLKLQQEAAALKALKGGATSTAAGPGGDPGFTGDKAKDLALIAKRESGGDPTALNYVAKEDPTAYARGATASGKYQIVNSTWAEGMRLAGLDPSKYAEARQAPEAVQDQVASALYDKYGSKPWVKGARDWVKGPDGKYQLATVAPSAPGAPAAPPAAPGAAPAPPAPPGVQVGGPAPPPPGGPAGPSGPAAPGAGGMAQALPPSGSPTTVLRETQERGPDGRVRTVVRPQPAISATSSPPPAALPPPPANPQAAANASAILGGIENARTATPASAMPAVAGPGAGPSAQPLPPVEAGWGAGNRATGYGGGSPPPGVAAPAAPAVTPPPAGVTPPGGIVAAPPAAPQPPAQAAPPPFVMRPLTASEAAATSGELPPDVAAEFARDKAGAKTTEEWYAVNAKEQAAKLAQRTAANTERLRIEAAERTQYNTRLEKEQERYNTRLEKEQERLAAIEAARVKEEGEMKRLHATAAETRLTNKEAVVNSVNQKGLETTTKELAHAIVVERQMEGFRSLSESVGTPGWMNTTKFPGSDQSISERLQQLGVKQDDLAGFQQLQQGMVDITRTLREGVQMGAMSDKDLDFIQRMGPTQWMDKDTRLAAVDYIQKAYRAKRRFAEEVNSEMARGTNYGDALAKANDKVKDFVPMVPRELADNFDNPNVQNEERLAWARRENVRPGTLFHFPNGDVRIMRRPQPKQEGG